MTVMAISTAKTNAELVAQCHQLGYITGDILDTTYGLGRFWKLWRPNPAAFTTNDIDRDREHPAMWHYDFRHLPDDWTDGYDTVIYDPPYKLNGTGGSVASDDDYGVTWESVPRDDKLQLARDGATECARVLRPGGHLLWKMQDQIEAGRLRPQTKVFWLHATSLGLELVDELHLVSYRPQPAGRRQLHARRNYSTMQVYRKAKP